MRMRFHSVVSAGVFGALIAFPACADVTAEEVRDRIVGLYESVGYSVTIASEDMSGGVLTLSGVNVAMSLPEDSGTISMSYGTVELAEISGTVEIRFDPRLGIMADMVPPDSNDRIEAAAHADLDNLRALVSGTPEDMTIDVTGDGGGIMLDSLIVDGETIPMLVSGKFGTISQTVTLLQGADERITISGAAEVASFGLAVDVKEPDGDGFLTGAFNMADMRTEFAFDAAHLPDMANPEMFNPVAMLDAGFDVATMIEYGATDIDVNFQDGRDRFAMTSGMSGGAFGMIVSNQEFSYDIRQSGVTVNLSSSELPIPSVSLAFDELDFSVGVPLAAEEDGGPSDFHYRTALRGLTVVEAVWAMVDPGQMLPRDPATIAVDISGKVQVLVDLLAPENLDKLDDMDEPPWMPLEVSLNELTALFGGAALTGSGAATFDPDSPIKIDGVPLPVGEVNLHLKGAFGLIDTLSTMGLIPPDAGMGIKGMMGAFARPIGEDEFESKIEMTPEGAILANGQRIQ